MSITLINPRPSFVERIRLHQLVTGSDDAVVDYASVLGRASDSSSTRRRPSTRRTARWRWRRAAPSATTISSTRWAGRPPAPTVPGAAEFAHTVGELEHAERLRTAVDELDPGAPLTVVGGGPTGIETAAELAEEGRPVTLVCGGGLGPYLSAPGRRSVARRLATLGVTVLDDRRRGRAGGRGACSPTDVSCPAPSPSGPRASTCRTWRRAAACAPTRRDGCSPTRR